MCHHYWRKPSFLRRKMFGKLWESWPYAVERHSILTCLGEPWSSLWDTIFFLLRSWLRALWRAHFRIGVGWMPALFLCGCCCCFPSGSHLVSVSQFYQAFRWAIEDNVSPRPTVIELICLPSIISHTWRLIKEKKKNNVANDWLWLMLKEEPVTNRWV